MPIICTLKWTLLTNFLIVDPLGIQVAAQGVGDSESGNFGSYVLNLEDGRKGGRCSVCGKEFSDRSSARKHVENIHFPGSFIYSCKFCGETFTKKNMMYMHISKFHKK